MTIFLRTGLGSRWRSSRSLVDNRGPSLELRVTWLNSEKSKQREKSADRGPQNTGDEVGVSTQPKLFVRQVQPDSVSAHLAKPANRRDAWIMNRSQCVSKHNESEVDHSSDHQLGKCDSPIRVSTSNRQTNLSCGQERKNHKQKG